MERADSYLSDQGHQISLRSSQKNTKHAGKEVSTPSQLYMKIGQSVKKSNCLASSKESVTDRLKLNNYEENQYSKL